MQLSTVLFSLALFCCGAGTAFAAGERQSVPIEQHVAPEGILYSVVVGVDGKPVDLVMDSGSIGVRVLGSSLPGSLASADDPTVFEGFANGVQLHGQRTTTSLTFGTLSTSLPIEDIEKADCAPRLPKCLVAKSPKGFFHDLQGIIGISLESPGLNRPISNPLQGVASAWIIELPEPGSKSPGQLILNPSGDDLKGFTDYPAGTGGRVGAGRDNPIPGCIKNDGNGRSFCGPVVLDTGKPLVTVITDEFKDTRSWTPGSPAELSFGSGAAALVAKFTVKPSVPPSRVLLGAFPLIGQPAPRILAGAEPFLLFDVLYDATNEKIGLRHR
jgi:hypothetical protein